MSWFSESLHVFSNGTLLTVYCGHVPSVKQRVVDKEALADLIEIIECSCMVIFKKQNVYVCVCLPYTSPILKSFR